jgi:penicillin-binding protein 1A
MVAEDIRFLRHGGVDLFALLRASRNYLLHSKISGGSTIEQQYVRTLRQRYERTIVRKLSEILLAVWMSQQISKREIAERYLQVAYFGWRMIGVKAAANRLGINLEDLSDRDAALIVAALKYPLPRELITPRLKMLYARQRYIQNRVESTSLEIPG